MTKVIEAVRQLRGEAHPIGSRCPGCNPALAQAAVGLLGTRHGSGNRDFGEGLTHGDDGIQPGAPAPLRWTPTL